MNTSRGEIRCPRGHFLGQPLVELGEAIWAERRRCRQCKQDVFLVVAGGVIRVSSAVY